jgi:hypothetical protein
MINYDEMAEAPDEQPTDNEIKSVGLLVQKQCDLEDEIEALEKKLKTTKEALRKVSWEQLPEAMFSLKCTSFELADGSKVEVGETLRCSITKANEEWCFNWLRESGNGDLIRNVVSTTFGVGEETSAEMLGVYLDSNKQPYDQKQSVHPSTLKAFCGVELDEREPDEEWRKHFGIFEQRISKITRP